MGSGSCVTPQARGSLAGEPCWGGIEQASPDHRGCEMPHAHNMVHIDRKGVHGSLPPPRHMERLRWQRQPRSSGKHLKEDGIKKVADEDPGGSNTGFIHPLSGRRITLLWLCTFCLMDYKEKKPRGSRCKISGACLNASLALVERYEAKFLRASGGTKSAEYAARSFSVFFLPDRLDCVEWSPGADDRVCVSRRHSSHSQT